MDQSYIGIYEQEIEKEEYADLKERRFKFEVQRG
jgi:hypothetical protein